MYGNHLRKTLLKGLPGGGGGRVFSAGEGLTPPSGGRKKKIEWARLVPKAPEEPWDSRGPILRTWRPFSTHFGPFVGFWVGPPYLRLQHWHSTSAFDIGIRHWHSALAFNIDIQHWHSTLRFNIGIQL